MKQTAYLLLTAAFVLTVTIEPTVAQRGGGDRGSRGGFDRSRMFGGDRGDRGSSGRGFGGDRGGSSTGRSWGGSRGGSGGPGGRPQFDPAQTGSRIAGFFDRNRDGQIDPQELERMPSSFRERFKSAGIDLSRGVSVAEFGQKAGEAIQARMAGRGGTGEEGRRGRDEGRGNDVNSTKTSTGKTVFKQSERKKLRQELPAEYKEGDADGDGQVALFEWAAWKRSDMFAFFELDENRDGFLTPRELNQADSEEDRGIALKRDRLAISSGSSGRRGGASRVRSAGTGSSARSTRSPEQNSRDTSRANYYFGALDRDRDGVISDEEWSRSRTVRGTLERAGIQIRSMSKTTFVDNYLKAAAQQQSSDGGDRGGSDPRRSWGDRGGSDRGGSDRGGFGRTRGDRGGRGR